MFVLQKVAIFIPRVNGVSNSDVKRVTHLTTSSIDVKVPIALYKDLIQKSLIQPPFHKIIDRKSIEDRNLHLRFDRGLIEHGRNALPRRKLGTLAAAAVAAATVTVCVAIALDGK